jgi:hypothetical protein
MSEMYVAGRDAHVAGSIRAGQVKPIGVYHAPAYTQEEDAPGQSVSEYKATLSRLAGFAPGAVTRKVN